MHAVSWTVREHAMLLVIGYPNRGKNVGTREEHLNNSKNRNFGKIGNFGFLNLEKKNNFFVLGKMED